MSEAAVHRPSQAWHSVHTRGLCPSREPEEVQNYINSLGRDSHRHLHLKEDQHAQLEISCHGLLQEGHQDVPQSLGASEDLSHWRVHFLPLWSRPGLPREIHVEARARHFTTETAAKKRVPVAGGNPVCPVLKQPEKGLFSS